MAHREYQLLIPAIARYAYKPEVLRGGILYEYLRQQVYGARWALWRKVATPKHLSEGGHVMNDLVESNFTTLLRLLPPAMVSVPDRIYAHIAIARELQGLQRILRTRFGYTNANVEMWIVKNRCNHILAADITLKNMWSVLIELINGYGVPKNIISTNLDVAIENHRHMSFASAAEHAESVKRAEELTALRARHGV